MFARRCIYLVISAVSALGCGATETRALRTRTCGQEGPIRVFAHPEGESVGLLGETGGRWLVASGSRVRSIGACGEDPQELPELGEAEVGEGRVWILQREADRVGHWPVDGGAITWISETPGHEPIGLVPGRGYVVLERAAESDDVGTAVLIGLDGTRRELLTGVAAYDDDEDAIASDPEVSFRRRYRFQLAAGVLGYLDANGTLRVIAIDQPSEIHSVDDVGTYGLAPDGSWFVTEAASSGSPLGTPAAGTVHVRGSDETIALDRVEGSPLGMHGSGWLSVHPPRMEGIDFYAGPATSIFIGATRTEVAIPPAFVGVWKSDEGGRLYAVVEGALKRWDPFTDETEELSSVPEGLAVWAVDERAAVLTETSNPQPSLTGLDTEVTIVPLSGADPWAVPEIADAVGLLPDGDVVYMGDAPEGAKVAPLYWVDREGEPLQIDSSVSIFWSGVQLIDGDLAFRVDDGERSGLWRAALP